LGLGYLHVGESTPKLSAGEAQRLKLVKHLYKKDLDQLFVFDEPSVGLHPLDVQVLIKVLEQLLDRGATIILITHDLDLMLNADHLLDLGPRGGEEGGKIMAQGAPLQLLKQPNSLTLKYLAAYYAKFSKKK
jgi:excinuclease ABC subunit A